MVCSPKPPVAVDSGHPAIFNFYNWEQNHQSSGFRRYLRWSFCSRVFKIWDPGFSRSNFEILHISIMRLPHGFGEMFHFGPWGRWCSWDCYSVTTEFLNLHNVSLGYGAPLAYAEVQLSPLPHWVHPYCGISNPPKHHTTTSTMVSSRPTGPR